MNAWMLAAGSVALIAAAGHAFAGPKMFYRPMRSALAEDLHSGVLTGMWHLISIHFALSAVGLIAAGLLGQAGLIAWLMVGQFAGYAIIYLLVSFRLGGPGRLPQWTIFAAVAVLACAGAFASP